MGDRPPSGQGLAGRAPDWQPWAVAVAMTALVVWAFWNRYRFLAASPYPLGIDGYFYPIQLRSILESGTLGYAGSIGPWPGSTSPGRC